ncbi:MAG: matrixin family metalloprotease [Myxococcaceae bacterium]
MNAARWMVCVALLLSPVTLATPSGNRWALTSPCGTCAMGTQCVGNQCAVQYRLATSIDNNGGTVISGGVPYANFTMILQNSFVAWTTPRVSCNTSWNSVSAGTFSTPMGLGALNGMDRNNNIIFLSGANWTHLSNELALTTTTYFTSNHEIFDGDMEINNNITWSETAAANTYDLFSVTVHEAGHFLGLNHTTTSSVPVMYPTVSLGTAKRSLTSIDENDVCTVYPGAPGGQGTACTTQTDCTAPRVCEAIAGGTNKMCTADCTSAGDTCPAGYTCQASTNGFACLPQIGVPDQCKFCQNGAGCSSGLCLRFDTGVTFCSLNCTDNSQCGPNYTCQMPEGFCVPNSNTCTNQCTSATNCATGYDCTGGTCVPRGNTGDPCTVSLVCKPCNICTRESATSDTAFCRVCCGGMGQGGTCNACTNATCGANSTCATLTSGNSSVCIPSAAAPTTCQPCNNGQCAEGLACVYGRCRSACNPAAPGACQACFPNGASGACACPDEIATAGEPCGLIGATLAACGPGLACVGNANPICRSQCDVSTPNSCPTGLSCQMVSGIGVCMPGTEGSVCAPCTNTGACNGGLTCYLGRCYDPCNVNLAQTCGTCVQSAPSGVGICGCPDQVSQINEPCGVMPDVHSCQTGLRCLGGYCRGRCDPQIGGCPDPTVCVDQGGGNFFCAEGATGGGGGSSSGGGGGARGGGSAAGGGTATGGGTGGGTMDLGCGCGAGSEPVGLLVVALVGLWRRRAARR